MTLAVPSAADSSAQRTAASSRRSRARALRLTRFYDTPQPLPPGKQGDLIRFESFDDYDLPLSVSAVRILYHSRSAKGEDVAASAVVLFPAEKKPPAGGWPVIAWAHGSTGIARSCAPSLRRNLMHGSFLSMYVNLGYAVVASDYTGLGTSFRNAFQDAPSNAVDVIASIPAARTAVPQLGSRWIVMGVAEGGLTAMAVAQKQSELRDSAYLGAVAISDLADERKMLSASSALQLTSLAYGTKTVFPQFQPAEVLTEKGLALYRAIEQTCSDTGSVKDIAAAEGLKPGWDGNALFRRYLDRSTPVANQAYGPLLVITSQPNAKAPETISRMCKLGDHVQWEQYPENDPGRAIGDSVREQIAWTESRFAGRAAPTTCP